MSPLLTTIGHLAVTQAIMPATHPTSSRAKDGLMLLSFVFLCLGLGLLVYGAHLWLAARFAADVTMLATGGIAMALAGMTFAAVQGFFLYKAWRMKQMAANLSDTVQDIMKDVLDTLEQPIQDNPKTAVTIAAAAGYLATERLAG